MPSLQALVDGHTICQDQWKLFSVDVEVFHDGKSTLDLFHVVWFVYVVKLNCDVVRLDRHHGADGTVYQASICVDVAAQHDSCSNSQQNLSF